MYTEEELINNLTKNIGQSSNETNVYKEIYYSHTRLTVVLSLVWFCQGFA